MNNPYHPPEPNDVKTAEAESPMDIPSDKALHSTGSVALATLLGSPIAGAIVLAISLNRLNRKTAAWIVLVAGAMLTIFLMVISIFETLGNDIPSSVYVWPQIFGAWFVSRQLVGNAVDQQRQAGGQIASRWIAAGIGVLSLAGVLGITVTGLVLHQGIDLAAILGDFGQQVSFGDDEIFLDGDANTEDAEILAALLTEEEFFGQNGVSVRISQRNGAWTVSFVVQEDATHDDEILEGFRYLGQSIQDAGLGPPLTIELCDEYFQPLAELKIE